MCKEAAAVSQLQALGWVWVDDARWEQAKPQKYLSSQEIHDAYYLPNAIEYREIFAGQIAEMSEEGARPLSCREKMKATSRAVGFLLEKHGLAHDGMGWYKVEANNGA